MKQRIIIISILILLATGTLLALNIASDKPNKQKNGFNRTFIPGAITMRHFVNVAFEPAKILGSTASCVYFEDSKTGGIVKTDFKFENVRFIDVSFKGMDSMQRESLIFVRIDSPNLFIFVKNTPVIYRYNFATKEIVNYSTVDNFSKGVSISDNSFIVRGPDSTNADNCFKKIIANLDSSQIQVEDNITEVVNDGGFSTDGLMYYDNSTNLICYTYFYRNGFLVLDTNLSLIERFKTIDTVNTPLVFGKKIESAYGTSYTLSSPPQFVNLKGCVSNGLLYLRSNLLADNEMEKDFSNNSVFDVYRLLDGKYKGSFYLPTYQKRRASNFFVCNNMIIASYGKHVFIYKLNLIKLMKPLA